MAPPPTDGVPENTLPPPDRMTLLSSTDGGGRRGIEPDRAAVVDQHGYGIVLRHRHQIGAVNIAIGFDRGCCA